MLVSHEVGCQRPLEVVQSVRGEIGRDLEGFETDLDTLLAQDAVKVE